MNPDENPQLPGGKGDEGLVKVVFLVVELVVDSVVVEGVVVVADVVVVVVDIVVVAEVVVVVDVAVVDVVEVVVVVGKHNVVVVLHTSCLGLVYAGCSHTKL